MAVTAGAREDDGEGDVCEGRDPEEEIMGPIEAVPGPVAVLIDPVAALIAPVAVPVGPVAAFIGSAPLPRRARLITPSPPRR